MRKFVAVAMGSVVAFAGFAGAANASATVDLIWIDISNVDTNGNPICLRPANRDCPQLGTTLSSVAVSDNITLGVIITAGAGGFGGGGVSVNYGDALPNLSVVQFSSLTTPIVLPFNLGITTNQPPYIDNINAGASPPLGIGIGLPPGVSAYLGTVTFRKDLPVNGIFEIAVGTDGPGGTDGVLRLSDYAAISAMSTYNSAFVFNPGPTPTPTATPPATPTATPTAIPTATPTSTPTATPGGPATPTAIPTYNPPEARGGCEAGGRHRLPLRNPEHQPESGRPPKRGVGWEGFG